MSFQKCKVIIFSSLFNLNPYLINILYSVHFNLYFIYICIAWCLQFLVDKIWPVSNTKNSTTNIINQDNNNLDKDKNINQHLTNTNTITNSNLNSIDNRIFMETQDVRPSIEMEMDRQYVRKYLSTLVPEVLQSLIGGKQKSHKACVFTGV